MNSILIDIIFVIFLLLMTLIGYKKGFITRLYDVLTTILVLFLTCILAKPLSDIWTIYSYNENDLVATIVGTAINYFVVMIVLFVILFVIKKIIGFLIKPLLKGIMEKFSITSFVDKTFGVILSIIEGIIISYLVLVFAFMPFYDSGKEMVEETILAKRVVNLIPDVAQDVTNLTESYQNAKSNETTSQSLQSLTEILLTMQDYQLLTDEQLETLIQENVAKELEKEKITLSDQQKQQIEDLLVQTGYNKEQIERLLANINVSGE